MDGADTLIYFGGAVKDLGDGRIGGQLVVFSGPDEPDLQGEFFTKDTDFWDAVAAPILYAHGKSKALGRRRLGAGTLKSDDAGVWIEGQLSLRDDYEKGVYKMVQAGKLGWSSGTAPHLIERAAEGKSVHLKSWPIVEASLTPKPVEPRTLAVPLKSLDLKGEYLGDTDTIALIAVIGRLSDRLCYAINDIAYDQSSKGDKPGRIRAAIDEFAAAVVPAAEFFAGADAGEAKAIKGLADAADPYGALRLASIKAFVADVRDGLKAGRKVSKDTRQRLMGVHDHLHTAATDLHGFLSESDPDRAADSGADAGEDGGKSLTLARARTALALLDSDPIFSRK